LDRISGLQDLGKWKWKSLGKELAVKSCNPEILSKIPSWCDLLCVCEDTALFI
jgi:hypothetical protein